jgi:hypothetical protein
LIEYSILKWVAVLVAPKSIHIDAKINQSEKYRPIVHQLPSQAIQTEFESSGRKIEFFAQSWARHCITESVPQKYHARYPQRARRDPSERRIDFAQQELTKGPDQASPRYPRQNQVETLRHPNFLVQQLGGGMKCAWGTSLT